ncbi:uncharacterized protein LOC120554051 [Perca fluviatilis]|uniref:uncharacterized protein LOC120554051 n=1 Tax=Perca fluviatilis TaxID=8168 RepID=UPI0019648557|nr:uncharacterized protein LOC120554051 [Perca fluviatilis]
MFQLLTGPYFNQVASRVLGIPCSKIHVSETSTNTVPNTSPTAASASSDLNGAAVLNACRTLSKSLAPYKTQNPKASWEDWAFARGGSLGGRLIGRRLRRTKTKESTREAAREGALGDSLEELDVPSSHTPETGLSLVHLNNFNIHADKSATYPHLLSSFALSLSPSPPAHNHLDLIFTINCSTSNLTVTPLHTSDHFLISYPLPLSQPYLNRHRTCPP